MRKAFKVNGNGVYLSFRQLAFENEEQHDDEDDVQHSVLKVLK